MSLADDKIKPRDAVVRRQRGVIPGLAAGALAGALAIYVSYAHLKQPQNSLDWAALIVSGLTVGIIAFFIIWGHFQSDPEPENPENQPN